MSTSEPGYYLSPRVIKGGSREHKILVVWGESNRRDKSLSAHSSIDLRTETVTGSI